MQRSLGLLELALLLHENRVALQVTGGNALPIWEARQVEQVVTRTVVQKHLNVGAAAHRLRVKLGVLSRNLVVLGAETGDIFEN